MIATKKKALITGVTGQDGSYLAEFLLEKGYEVHGIKRRASSLNTQRVDHIYQDPHVEKKNFVLHYGDLSDSSNLTRIIQEVQPDEIYNLAAQSYVAVSFESPEYTADVDALGALRILEAIRLLGLEKKTKFYQASTSELYGLVQETPQTETTPFYPRSPYAVAKMYAYWITVNYREAYGMYACNGILFNHESPRRGETFVTRKITRGLANISQGAEACLYMGNLDALRDWGHAKDYVRMQWMMMQQESPDDFVIATGVQYSVRDFIRWSAAELGISLRFEGQGLSEVAIVDKPLIQYAVEEAIAAGVDTLIFVTGRHKRAIEDHFDSNPELEHALRAKGRHAEADMIHNILPKGVECIFVRQPEQLGLGHAVLCAERAVGDEPFAVLLADDFLTYEGDGVTADLVRAYERTGKAQISVMEVNGPDISKYGVVIPGSAPGSVLGLVEKPPYETAPSNLASLGRYVLGPDIFDVLREQLPGAGGETQLADAINIVAKRRGVEAISLDGQRFDCGSINGYLEAITQMAAQRSKMELG